MFTVARARRVLLDWGGRTRTSNFQTHVSHPLSTAAKLSNNLGAATDAEPAAPEQKSDPETVTEPSSGSAPSGDL